MACPLLSMGGHNNEKAFRDLAFYVLDVNSTITILIALFIQLFVLQLLRVLFQIRLFLAVISALLLTT